MIDYPKATLQARIEEISNQMKNSIYTIYKEDGKTKIGIGFFCYLNFKKDNIPVVVINHFENFELYEEIFGSIKIIKNKTIKEIKIGHTRIKNKIFNLSILEVKYNIKDKILFLKTDKIDTQYYDNKESIYIIQYFNIKNIKVSFGIIDTINNSSEFKYFGDVESENSKYSLIFNLFNNKLIGIHNQKISKNVNKGLFFHLLIDKFIIKYKHNFFYNNEIDIIIKVSQNEVNKKINFLDNYGNKNNAYESHENIKKLLLNSDLFINNKSYNKKINYFIPEEKGEYKIKLIFKMNMIDYSYMFAECRNIIKINFISLNTKIVKNMKYMFYGCENLETINSLTFDTKNVKDMSYMFYNCKNMKDLDLLSFDLKMNINMSYMLYNCKNYSIIWIYHGLNPKI